MGTSLARCSQQGLFKVIRDIWAKPIDDPSEMTIWKTNNLWCCHAGFERLEDLSER